MSDAVLGCIILFTAAVVAIVASVWYSRRFNRKTAAEQKELNKGWSAGGGSNSGCGGGCGCGG